MSTYPFNVMGKAWHEVTPDHLSELPRKGDSVVGGNPARFIKKRFDDELISLLLQ